MLAVLERRGYLIRHADGGYRSRSGFSSWPTSIRRSSGCSGRVAGDAGAGGGDAAVEHLVIHFARRILVVAQVDSPEPMGFAVRLGAHFPFRPDRASSRVLSAFQPEPMQEELIAELLANSARASRRHACARSWRRWRARAFTWRPATPPTASPTFARRCSTTATAPSPRSPVPYLRQRDVTCRSRRRARRCWRPRRISAGLGAPPTRD